MELSNNIDRELLKLGCEFILSSESLLFYHSAIIKFEEINTLGTWFSPIKIKEKCNYYNANNINITDNVVWCNSYDFRFINKKPLKLLSINTYKNDGKSLQLQNMITSINDNIKLLLKETDIKSNDDKTFLLDQENDPEYLLSYYLSKYSSFDGWITIIHLHNGKKIADKLKKIT